MQGIFLNLRELDALEGLPWPVVALYVLALRPLMDAATRTVGVRHAVSWSRLGLAINPEPHPGYPVPRVSKWSAKRMGMALERAGLVRIQSSEVHRKLVFLLPLVSEFSLAQKKAATKPLHQAATPPTEGKQGVSRHTKNGKAATYLGSMNQPLPPLPPRGQSKGKAPATTAAGEGEGLIYPEKLTSKGRASLQRHLQGLVEAQDILDELGARMARGGVEYPTRYAMTLIRQAQAGEFIPDKAEAYRKQREAQARAQAAIQADEDRRAAVASTISSAAARDAMRRLRKVTHGSRR